MLKPCSPVSAFLAVASVSLALASPTLAQETRTIVVGFAPGGSVDSTARVLAESLQDITGDTYIVENRTGAAGRLAVQHTKRAEPDGTTLMLVPHGPVTLFPYLFTNLGFEPAEDFTPISRAVQYNYVLAAGKDVPVTSGDELKRWAEENPGQTSFGTPGTGTIPHFIGETIGNRLGVDLTNVPYKGATLVVNDLVAGIIPLGTMPATEALPMADAGRIKIVAISGAERSPLTPDIPTMQEVGIDFALDGWFAVYGPAGMDEAVVKELNAAMREALERPKVIERLAEMGLNASPSTPAELAEIQASDREVWRQAVEATNFQPLD